MRFHARKLFAISIIVKHDFKQCVHTHLHALAVVQQHVAELLGHHVQVSLLALVGPGQNIELGEVGGQIIERSRKI